MNVRTSMVLRRALTAFAVAATGTALLLPIAARSRDVERRARSLNASFVEAGGASTAADRRTTQRVEGTPREVFAWLREIEAAPPTGAFTIDLSIGPPEGEESTLVAELHSGDWEIDR